MIICGKASVLTVPDSRTARSANPIAGMPTTRLIVPKPWITTPFSHGITNINNQRKKNAPFRNTPSRCAFRLDAPRNWSRMSGRTGPRESSVVPRWNRYQSADSLAGLLNKDCLLRSRQHKVGAPEPIRRAAHFVCSRRRCTCRHRCRRRRTVIGNSSSPNC